MKATMRRQVFASATARSSCVMMRTSGSAKTYRITPARIMTAVPRMMVYRVYFTARSGFFAPSDWPTSVVTAVAKANAGMYEMDSAVSATE